MLIVGKQHSYQEQLFSSKGHITLQLAVNAASQKVPPMLIFSISFPRDINGIPNDWKLSTSSKGYIDSDLFCEWLQDVFAPHCGRPVLLKIVDNLGRI